MLVESKMLPQKMSMLQNAGTTEFIGNILKNKKTCQVWFLLFLVTISQLSSVSSSDVYKREAGDEVTPQVENSNSSTANTTSDMDNDSSKTNTGAVVAASVIAVVACIAVVIAVYIFKRRRQSRLMDKEKKMQIQMSSARNAGVYQDLTVSVPVDEKPPASPEHERLKSSEHV